MIDNKKKSFLKTIAQSMFTSLDSPETIPMAHMNLKKSFQMAKKLFQS